MCSPQKAPGGTGMPLEVSMLFYSLGLGKVTPPSLPPYPKSVLLKNLGFLIPFV